MPGPKVKRDGTRQRIGGPYRNRIGLSREEYLILIEAFNQLIENGQTELQRTLYTGEKVSMKVEPFIKKLLKVGTQCGWASIPCQEPKLCTCRSCTGERKAPHYN